MIMNSQRMKPVTSDELTHLRETIQRASYLISEFPQVGESLAFSPIGGWETEQGPNPEYPSSLQGVFWIPCSWLSNVLGVLSLFSIHTLFSPLSCFGMYSEELGGLFQAQ